MEVTHGLTGGELDLILHSPGGSPEAAEAFVNYMRSKFTHVRAVVPHAAMSAATMIACACEQIVMGKHSSLGPIDPQFIMGTQLGVQSVPAQAIKDQFDKAQVECQDPSKLNSWYPILGQYGPALLVQCENALALSRELVAAWLTKYMFCGNTDGETIAVGIAEKLASHNDHKSHGRHLPRPTIKSYGLDVVALEDDQTWQDLALSVFHATTHTFGMTPAVKIIENHMGRAFIKQQQVIAVQPADVTD